MPASPANDGFEIHLDVLTPAMIETLETALRFANGHSGTRNLLTDVPECAALARSREILALVEPVLGPGAFPVRALFFDKSPGANWKVPWHQDLAIAVAERMETPGFSGWSVKEGVHHVHPPAEILERMLAVRLHLDECGEDNGPLRVIPGSHREGKLSTEGIERWKRHGKIVNCVAPKGSALLMRPLLLHASSPATHPKHRRVIHIEYASMPLPGGLRWFIQLTENGTAF